MKKTQKALFVLCIVASAIVSSCVFQWQQQQQQMYEYQPERWCYIMSIRHSTKDIAVNSQYKPMKGFSLLSLDEQRKESEFKRFSNFGKQGIVIEETSWMPDVTNTLNYVVNEIVLHPGEQIEDFHGFIIKAEKDCLLVSNGERDYRIKEKKDWSEVESEGCFYYGGHIGERPLFPWNFKYWLNLFTFKDANRDKADPQSIKAHRYLKWCLSPSNEKSNHFHIYSMYIPREKVQWREYKIWYDSADE